MLNNTDQQFESDVKKIEIMLWGATFSGKTTLWKAFLQQLSLIRADLKKKKSDINLDITDKKGNPLHQDSDSLQFNPTSALDYDVIIYKRNSSKQDDFIKSVNTHAHWIGVFDHMGQTTLDAVSNPTASNDAALIRKNLEEKTKCILIILNKGNKSPGEFYTHFENLKNLLMDRAKQGKQNKRHKMQPCYIAACITKLDLLGDGAGDLDADDLVIAHFGADIGSQVLGAIEELRTEYKLYLCAVSATGIFIDDKDNKKKANIDSATSTIINKANWSPENVEKPFFWLFAQVEKDRLKAIHKGMFYSIFSKDFSEARLEQYVEYKDLLSSINW